MPLKPTAAALASLALLAGFGAGFAANEALRRREVDRAGSVQRREGGHRYVNPLLECDLAEDILRNRELVPFKRKVADAVAGRIGAGQASSVGVYFRELNDGIWFALGETGKYAPASLRKVPLLIAVLKQAEGPGGQGLLDREVTFDLGRDYTLDQNVKPSVALVPGRRYRVGELLQRMVIQSDNNAFTLLARAVDPAELERVYALLSMRSPRATAPDEQLSVETYASFFRILFNATYLSRSGSEWALALLARSEFRAGLVAGVPPGVEVAHKFGEKSDPATGTVQLHDCGIVYYPNNPYLLCVMSQGRDFELLDDVLVAVSRLVYDEVASQNRAAR